jgi:hypothetical protein
MDQTINNKKIPNFSWNEISGMSVPRYQATSVVDDNDNMWVFGGTYDDDLGKKSIFLSSINFL